MLLDRVPVTTVHAVLEFVADRGHRDATQISFCAILTAIPLAVLQAWTVGLALDDVTETLPFPFVTAVVLVLGAELAPEWAHRRGAWREMEVWPPSCATPTAPRLTHRAPRATAAGAMPPRSGFVAGRHSDGSTLAPDRPPNAGRRRPPSAHGAAASPPPPTEPRRRPGRPRRPPGRTEGPLVAGPRGAAGGLVLLRVVGHVEVRELLGEAGVRPAGADRLEL